MMAWKEYSSFSLTGVKKNPSVIPVIACIVVGITMAATYTLRLATRCPDVTWNVKKNPEPWDHYSNKHYKFLKKEPYDPETYEHPRPKF